MSAKPPSDEIRKAAAILGARGGAAGRGDKKRRDKAMLQAAGRKGAAIRWAKKTPEEKKPER